MNPATFAGVSALVLAAATAAHAETTAATVAEAVVTTAGSGLDLTAVPTTSQSVSAETIARTVNVSTGADLMRYVPNVLVRERHVGDLQAPMTTRTSGVGASARSLIYVDGMLISALVGNNNTLASPKWGLVAPEAVERVDVLYGPFAAAYAGNSIGAVAAFATRMPTAFQASAEVQGSAQSFRKYGDDETYWAWRASASIGDRRGPLAFRLSYNHLDSQAQPLTYATATTPASTSASGAPTTGSFADANRTNAPIQVLGSTGIEDTRQDNLSGRAVVSLGSSLLAAYTFGLFRNDVRSTVNSYLRDASGQTVYSGALNIGGRAYSVAASAFSNGVYRQEDLQLAQGLSLTSATNGVFDFELAASAFDTLKGRQRIPATALPGAFAGGAGSVVHQDDTGWYTLDARGTLRPAGPGGAHVVTFGAHQDRYHLNNPRFALSDWIAGSPGATMAYSAGRTRTQAIWIQDAWTLAPTLKATLGARHESWRAYGGVNYSASPALNVAQPQQDRNGLSPKAVLAWTPAPGWSFKGSLGVAYRFPTVQELYQAVTTGTTLSTPNPDLRPERATAAELSVERSDARGSIRVSLFAERIKDTLLSQTAPLGSAGVLVGFVQNVDRTHATGVELVASRRDVLVRGLELSGWVTYVETRTDRDRALPAAVGKSLPQIPRWRGAVTATYAVTRRLDATLAARYSDRSFATIDNSDRYANTYQGFSGYFVADARVRYRLNDHLAAGLGVTNLNDRAYFLFHPFPQRTVNFDLKYVY